MRSSDLYELPPDLPVPVDDGAADHLPARTLPALALPSTHGGVLDLAQAAREAGTLVLYVYPRSGLPGVPSLDGWDAIPGARGCTPQSCAFRDHDAELGALGARVVGMSAQSPQDQLDFATREHLSFALVSDAQLQLAAALDLPTFEVAGLRLYKRITLIAREGVIVKVCYPVFPPDRNAAEVVAWLRAHPAAA
jgi:peroxiredoxin